MERGHEKRTQKACIQPQSSKRVRQKDPPRARLSYLISISGVALVWCISSDARNFTRLGRGTGCTDDFKAWRA